MSSTNQSKRNEVFLQNDPVYELVSKLSVSGIWFLAVLIDSLVYIAVGKSIDYFYPDVHGIQRIFQDSGENINSINVWLIFVPTVWAFYRWLPEAIIKQMRQIQNLGIVLNNAPENPKCLPHLLSKRLDIPWIYLVGLVGAIISSLYLYFRFIPAQYESLNKITNFWYYNNISHFFFFLLYLPANYVLFVSVIRLLVLVFTLNKHFEGDNVILFLYPFHPDKCGGLGGIGLLISRIVLIVVLIPFCTLILGLYPKISGGTLQINSIIIVYVIYVIIVPFILIYPLWKPHLAIAAYKNKQLAEISKEMLEIDKQIANGMTESNLEQLKSKQEYYKFLQERYVLLEKQIPVWPISLPDLRNFGAIASSPIVVVLVSAGLTRLSAGLTWLLK